MIAAAPATAVDAERDFARRGQTDGMWTAFRATAAEDAIMFLPQATKAHDFLKDRKDPLLSYMWWPAEAFVSCDGRTAVTTGPAVRGAYRGYFTTIWRKHADGGWKWVLDHGDGLVTPRAAGEKPVVRRASCRLSSQRRSHEIDRGFQGGSSADGTLIWRWIVAEDGARMVRAEIWDGAVYRNVLKDEVDAPAP